MIFVQFPNGKVWRVSESGWIEGAVVVPDYEDKEDLEARLDAIAEAATGSICGLADFAYQYRGRDIVSFSGRAEELPVAEADYAEGGFVRLMPEDLAFATALQQQYGLSPEEVKHALGALDNCYGEESVVDVLGSFRQMCAPAYPAACDYVRVVVDGYEVAYWVEDEWQEDPACVMGALMGAAKGPSFT
jgi:hypothetical protein